MKKILILLLVLTIGIYAVNKNEISGSWKTVNKTTENGVLTIEKEFMNLNQNNSFSIVVLVSVQKDQAYIKDLRIEATGIWEVHDNTLVFVVKNVSVPVVQEVNQISQQSIDNLAANFKYKYENDPIHIVTIKFLNNNSLTLISEKYRETSYSR